LAWFTVDAPGRQTAVYLQRVDPQSLELQSPVSLGFTPLGPKTVPLGAYRVTVATTDSTAFAEFNVLLAEPGRDRSTSLLVTDDWRNGSAGKSADPAFARALRARLVESAAVVSGMGHVPAGEYSFGWMNDDHPTTGKRKAVLPAFYVDYAEVSNQEYKKFCDDSGHPQPHCWTEFGYHAFAADAPVVCVTWQDAEAYARWTGKRLPSMFEWQAAARGLEGHNYPDGADGPPPEIRELTTDDLRHAQSSDGGTLFRAMREFTCGVGAGVGDSRGYYHFCSNVRELSGTIDPASQSVVVLGRCWHDAAEYDLAKVLTGPVESTSFSHGFRCAKSSVPFQSMKMKGDTNAKLPNSEP
jgi:formylglycine-generating enzyme required for sulfatase activity